MTLTFNPATSLFERVAEPPIPVPIRQPDTVYMVLTHDIDDYYQRVPGECIGIAFTPDGAREIIRSYRSRNGRLCCDIETAVRP